MQAAKRTPVDLRAWAVGLMERDNRKSHLAPQLSPTTQDLLKSSETPNDGNNAYTPTSGEIPIAGAIASPRDYHTHSQNRSPTRNGGHSVHSSHGGHGSIGRAAGSNVHPGMGQRAATAGTIPKASTPDLTHPSSGSTATFSLPVRPAPPGGPLPPAPPRKSTPDDPRRENRRQAFVPANGSYGNMAYPPAR